MQPLKNLMNRSLHLEVARFLPEAYKEAPPTVPWQQVAGLRNRIVHDYWLGSLDHLASDSGRFANTAETPLVSLLPFPLPALLLSLFEVLPQAGKPFPIPHFEFRIPVPGRQNPQSSSRSSPFRNPNSKIRNRLPPFASAAGQPTLTA
jgi:hypothetical protein